MATMRLIPSTYSLSNTTYLSVTNPDNMYANTDSTNYATVTNSQTGTTTYYIYLKGFNFDDIPSDAEVSSFTVKFKAYESGASTSTSYRPRICNNTTTLTGGSSVVSASVSTITFTNVTNTWDQIKNYGSDFSIRISNRRSNRNTTSYLYIYGAEILVEYTIPVYHTVTASTSAGTISPSGTTTVLEGDSYTLTISGVDPPIATDNNVDVTSQLQIATSGSATLIPASNTMSGFSASNIGNAYHDATNTSYADLSLSARTTGQIRFSLGGAVIPAGAAIQNVSCSATLQYNRGGSSSSATGTCQMYAGTTAKGSQTTIISSGGTDVAKTTFNLSIGSWTASEINNAVFQIDMHNGASGTVRHMYVYGLSFNVTYTFEGVVYIYTIASVMGDHTIVISQGVVTTALYTKINGTWTQVTAAYKKVNGSWVQQTDLTTVFQSGVNYKKG